MRNLYSLRASLDGSLLRTSTMRGIEYLVCPVVSKLGNNVEWPVNAPTPELIPSEVLRFAIHSRNGRPFVMNHPRKDGEYVSANSPDILEKYSFGFVSSAYYDEEVGGAKCEVWIDPLQAEQVGRDAVAIVNRVKGGETVEVSEGNYVNLREESGNLNGKNYGAVWELCINDHLAALPEGTIGACAIADGCGAGILKGSERSNGNRQEERSITLSLLTSDVKVSALSQARTPIYTGTETSKWSAPSFTDYVSSLHEGKENPTSVSQCSSSLKGKIAAHSLLGDPSASNIRDLTLFPCVNPSNGKLNENALRAILGGRGDAADISSSALTSARDVATRLLNKEFGAELSNSKRKNAMSDKNSEKGGFLRRLISSFSSLMKSSMSNNQLRWNLYEALKGSVRGLDYVYDEDPEAKTVKYCVVIRYGDGWEYTDYDYRWFQRTYSVDTEGNITLNDDAVEIEAVSDEWVPAKDQSMTKAINSSNSSSSDDKTCTCDKGQMMEGDSTTGECSCMKNKTDNNNPDQTEEMTMASAMKKKDLIAELCLSGAYKGLDEKTLNTLSEETLTSMLKAAEKATKEGKEVKEAKVEDGSGKVTVVVAAEKKADDKPIEPKELTEDQWMKAAPPHLRDMAAKYKAAEEEHRSSLITSLKDSSAFDEKELNEMSTPMLEKVAKTAGVDQQITASSSYDYSGKGLPVSTPLSSGTKETKKVPDTWAMSATAHNKKDKEATN